MYWIFIYYFYEISHLNCIDDLYPGWAEMKSLRDLWDIRFDSYTSSRFSVVSGPVFRSSTGMFLPFWYCIAYKLCTTYILDIPPIMVSCHGALYSEVPGHPMHGAREVLEVSVPLHERGDESLIG